MQARGARQIYRPLLLGLICGLSVAAAGHWAYGIFQPLDFWLYDLAMQWRPARPMVDARLRFVMIDDKSVGRINQWPLRRSNHAELMRGLAEVGVERVVWDMIFEQVGEPDRRAQMNLNQFASVLQSLKATDGAHSVWQIVTAPDEVDDDLMAAAMKKLPNFLAIVTKVAEPTSASTATTIPSAGLGYISRDAQMQSAKVLNERFPSLTATLFDVNEPKGLMQCRKPQPLNPKLLKAAAGVGHVMASVDADGLARRVPLLVQVGDRVMPSLVLASMMDFLGGDLTDVRVQNPRLIRLNSKRFGTTIDIPLDDQGCMLINHVPDWRNRFDCRSYVDVLEMVNPAVLADPMDKEDISRSLDSTTVVVGQTTAGGGDFVATPLNGSVPGTAVLMTAMNTIMTRQFIHQGSWSVVFVLTLGLPIVLSLVYTTRAAWLWWLSVLLVVFGLPALAGYLLAVRSFYLPMAMPVVAVLIEAVVLTAIGHLYSHGRAARMTDMLSRFVSPHVLAETEKLPSLSQLPPTRRRELTVLFVDVAGFTTASESSEPEEINDFLSRFYEMVMDELDRNYGTLDKLMGDGVLAYFGAADEKDKEHWAVSAAMAIRRRLAEIAPRWAGRGSANLQIRSGIATDYVSVGYFGGRRHAAYTLIGRAVNLASRLQHLGEGGDVIMDALTAERVRGQFPVEPTETLTIKGIDRPIETYRLKRPGAESGDSANEM